MPFYEKGKVRVYYEEAGSGFPLLLIPGGGLDSKISFFTTAHGPFNAFEEFKSEYRVITMDLRNAEGGQSTGPLETDRPWDAYTEDQLGVMDHLGIDRFMVMGFCIGNPLIWNLIKHAPRRVVAAVSAQPSGVDPQNPGYFYTEALNKPWGAKLCARQPGLNMETVEKFLSGLYKNADFVVTASRDFVRNCQTPLLVLPDDTKAHCYATAMEMAYLAPNAQVSLYPWKHTAESKALAVRHVRTFLKAHRPGP